MNTEFDQDNGAKAPANDNAAPDEAAHLDGFRAPEIDGGEVAEDDVQPLGEDGEPVGFDVEPDQITREAFWTVWKSGFGLPGMFAAQWKPLAIQTEETDTARAASDAVYEILEIYWPSALQPQGEMFARIATAAPFVLAKVMIVRNILQENRRARVEASGGGQRAEFKSRRAPQTPEAANDNAAPASSPVSWMDQEVA